MSHPIGIEETLTPLFRDLIHAQRFVLHKLLLLVCWPVVALLQASASFILDCGGWRIDRDFLIQLRKPGRYVSICLHTSNWDAIIAILFQVKYGFKLVYVIKEYWMTVPVLGRLFAALGFIGKRDGAHGQTTDFIDALQPHDNFRFIIMPEGQRAYGGKWFSGYYYIARELGATIELVVLDFNNHTLGLIRTDCGDSSHITIGDRDLDSINRQAQRLLSLHSVPLYPEHAYPVPAWCVSPHQQRHRGLTSVFHSGQWVHALCAAVLTVVALVLLLPYLIIIGAPVYILASCRF